MRRDLSFVIHPDTKFSIELPGSFEILRVGMRHETPVMWILFDPSVDRSKEWFLCVESGKSVPSDAHHVGSYSMKHGTKVFHVYWLTESTGT